MVSTSHLPRLFIHSDYCSIDDQASCESAHTATKAVCDAFDLESEACLTANLAFQKRCNLADLGESNGPNVLEGADGLEKMTKEALIGQVQKFKMAYALEKHSAIAMRSDFSAKLKRCNHLANKDKEASDSKALKKEEEKIENEKAGDPAKDAKKKMTPEEKKEKEVFDKELKGVEEKGGN